MGLRFISVLLIPFPLPDYSTLCSCGYSCLGFSAILTEADTTASGTLFMCDTNHCRGDVERRVDIQGIGKTNPVSPE